MMTPVIDAECKEKASSTSSKHQTKDETSSNPDNVESVISVSCQEREASTSVEDGSSKQRCNDDIKLYQVQPETPDCIIDVKNDTQIVGGKNCRQENICRICHLSSEDISGCSTVIKLGCACRGDLATSHRRCAEIWFKHRGCRVCEICGKTAKNVEDIRTTPNKRRMEIRALRIHQDGSQMMGSTTYLSDNEGSCGCRSSCCNILLMCLLLAFILPWIFRIDF